MKSRSILATLIQLSLTRVGGCSTQRTCDASLYHGDLAFPTFCRVPSQP